MIASRLDNDSADDEKSEAPLDLTDEVAGDPLAPEFKPLPAVEDANVEPSSDVQGLLHESFPEVIDLSHRCAVGQHPIG